MSRPKTPTVPVPPLCPCRVGSPVVLAYSECCERYHAGPLHEKAPTAEALMRSRYSAFTLDLTVYLRSTWHPSTRPQMLEPHTPGLQWLGLTVRQHVQQDDNHATVEFVARSKLAGRAHRLHEVSRFTREEGRWYYMDGQWK